MSSLDEVRNAIDELKKNIDETSNLLRKKEIHIKELELKIDEANEHKKEALKRHQMITSRPGFQARVACRYFLKGKCTNKHCTFSHETANVVEVDVNSTDSDSDE